MLSDSLTRHGDKVRLSTCNDVDAQEGTAGHTNGVLLRRRQGQVLVFEVGGIFFVLRFKILLDWSRHDFDLVLFYSSSGNWIAGAGDRNQTVKHEVFIDLSHFVEPSSPSLTFKR